jgi:hypothetical protein
MQQPFEQPESSQTKPKGLRVTVTLGVIVAAAILVSLWFLFEPLQNRRAASLHETVPVLSSAEQGYAKEIEIANIAVSRAENFLHQEVTTLNGELYNAGTARVQDLRVTAEFSNNMDQIVLSETRNAFGNPQQVLSPGERRSFEISFEHVPDSWNMQAPKVRIAHLQLSLK